MKFLRIKGKISAQPQTTLCIQFLDKENNSKKQYIAIGKTDLFYNSMGLCRNFTESRFFNYDAKFLIFCPIFRRKPQ